MAFAMRIFSLKSNYIKDKTYLLVSPTPTWILNFNLSPNLCYPFTACYGKVILGVPLTTFCYPARQLPTSVPFDANGTNFHPRAFLSSRGMHYYHIPGFKASC